MNECALPADLMVSLWASTAPNSMPGTRSAPPVEMQAFLHQRESVVLQQVGCFGVLSTYWQSDEKLHTEGQRTWQLTAGANVRTV
jgi:hypothetical protein